MTDKPVVTEDDMRLARKLARELDTLEGRARIALALAETRERERERGFEQGAKGIASAHARIADLQAKLEASRDCSGRYHKRIAELEAENKRLQSERDEYAQRWADACDREQRALGAETAWPATGTKGAVGQ